MFTCVLGRWVASTVLSVPTLRASLSGTFLQCLEFDQYPNLSEGADRVGGQLRGDKEFPFSGVTKSGRVWRNLGAGKRCSECAS